MIKTEERRNQLAQQMLRHLERETTSLQATHQLVKRIRTTLLETDTDQLHDLVEHLETKQYRDEGLIHERERLSNQLARILGLPQGKATISELIRQLDSPWKERLAESRRALRQEARAVYQLNRANLSIASQKGELIRSVLEGLTGKPTSSRYERSGHINHSDGGPVFEANF